MVGGSIDGRPEPCAGPHRSETSATLCARDACIKKDHTRGCLDTRRPAPKLALSIVSGLTSPSTGDEDSKAAYERALHPILHTHMPTTTEGTTTFGHQRALLNRLRAPEAGQDVLSDTASHESTFTFIHDILMLPGTLANLLGKTSPEDLIPRMTPALLAGFHAHIDIETTQPILVVSQRQDDVVQGMVVWGLDKEARDTIREYYRRFAHRHRALVGIDVVVKTALRDQTSPDDQWHIERRAVRAYVWFKRSLVDCELAAKTGRCPTWHLRDALEGSLAPRNHLRIDQGGKGDEAEDGYIGRDIFEYEREPEEEERTVVYGHLDYYLRASHDTGW